jgi:hypothetical protein
MPSKYRLRHLGAMLLLLAPWPASALDLGAGLEAGGSLTATVPSSVGSGASPTATAGVIAEQRLQTPALSVTLWEDVQTPFTAYFGSYLPLAVGIRAGPDSWILKPYFGGVVGYDVLVGSAGPVVECGEPCGLRAPSPFGPGVGGDVGVDWAWRFLRFGVEARATGMLSPLFTPTRSLQWVVLGQVLASGRAEF